MSSAIHGAGGLPKLGAGTINLSGTNACTGTTTVQVGSLTPVFRKRGSRGLRQRQHRARARQRVCPARAIAPSALINGTYTVGRTITVGLATNTASLHHPHRRQHLHRLHHAQRTVANYAGTTVDLGFGTSVLEVF